MRKTTRGFIPLVAIILLGLVVVAGGVIATVSIRHEGQITAPVATSTGQTATSSTYSAPVRPRVEGSGAGTAVSAPQASSTPVAQISATLDADTQAACTKANSEQASPKSVVGTIQALCRKLTEPAQDTPDQREAWANIEAKIDAWYSNARN